MAIRDRIAKALNLPVGSVTQTEQQIAAQVPASGALADPMPRDPADYVVPFAPGRPLIPALINPPREDGRTAPRRSEFPVAWNLQVTEQRVIPFKLLREISDGSDIVRKCIEVVKSGIAGMDWDISLSPDATERIMSESGGIGHAAAAKQAREELLPEITRCKDFWRMPDRINGMSFPEWIALAIEEMLVIDALTIYPNSTLDEKNLHSLEILDGTTIKPLLDDRGARPTPPYPAFQQILWGFPRGEFTYSADADGEFTADDLVYLPRTRRTFTPYGFSAVERALPVIDLYMKRLQWLRTEFTDGVTPDMLIKTDATYGSNPEILRAYERVFNDDLSGKTESRRRARILPEGMDPILTPGLDVKYKPDFDEYLVKQICTHFGVLPTQIGFAPRAGLGGTGVQDGEAASAQTLGMRPIVMWVEDILNQMSYRFLNMPRDLAFKLQYATSDDGQIEAAARQVKLASGQITVNEARAELGMPLFDFPEADMPIIPNNLVPMADVQEIAQGSVIGEVAPAVSAESEVEGLDGTGDMTEPDKTDDTYEIGKADDSFTPPAGVRAAAKRALEWLDEGLAGDGFTDTGRKRASDLARGAAVSAETINRMRSFFARHEADKKAEGFNSGEEGFPSPGRVAWDAWGGDAGKSWAESVNTDKGDVTETDKASDELDAFRKWAKGSRKRQFVFEHVPADHAVILNKMVTDDPDSARTFALVLKEKNVEGRSPRLLAGSAQGRAVNYFVSGEVPQFTWTR